MRKVKSYLVTFLLANSLMIAALGQNLTISGNVRNSNTKEGVGAVSVTIKGGTAGTFTDDKGNFRITVKNFPVILIFSSVGYEFQEVTVNSSAQQVEVEFQTTNALGQEVVVSANRVPQRILESPVSIERVSAANIRNASVPNYYDVVANLKGVDITTSSLTFKTPTTRGFNSSGNTRFNQLVDGMDNQAPGLNFSVGAIVGLSELDVDNLELLSGASSALYGPGGMNGTLLMTSKNPFKYQGLSFLVKEGIMNTDHLQREPSAYHNWNLRWAKKVSDRFAFKINFELIQAKDWLGTDYRNYNRIGTAGAVKPGTRLSDPNYDGINVYGDETTIDIVKNVLIPIAKQAPFLAPFIYSLDTTKQINVSRTGYTEKQVVNPNTVNFKLASSLHYKVSENTEAVLAAYWGTGNTVYTGSERYSLKDFKMGQYKIELNNRYYSLRAYTTQENAGESYNATVTTRLFNEAWKPSPTWYAQYAQTYLNALMSGQQNTDAHNTARALADQGRPAANSAQFRTLFDQIRKVPIKNGGGELLDKTNLYDLEGNYNLSHLTKDYADIIVGANFKEYVLNSQGTLFADSAGTIKTKEYGAYVQASRQVAERIKLTLSGRYDKNQNFKGRFTPRATALIKLAENNYFRLSYQTAYRFPSNQQQWISLDIGSNVRLLGGNPNFISFYNMVGNPVYTIESVQANSATKFDITNYELKPESVSSFEAGYKGLLMNGALLVDLYGYYGQYKDFLGRSLVVQSKVGATPTATDINNTSRAQVYSLPINVSDKVKTYGFGLSADARLPYNFSIGANIANDNLKDVPANFVAYFNAPKYKTNLSINNNGFGYKKRFGANLTWRWQDAFYYQGDFANGQLPAVHTVDAQISLKLPRSKSMFKLGASNLLNQYYYNAIGNSQIGGLYYISYGYNVY